MRTVLAALAISLVSAFLMPIASAQVPTPTTSIGVSMPAGPVTIALGAQHEIPVSVSLSAANFVCTQDASATVQLSVAGSPSELASVMAHFPANELKFAIPQGAYQNAAPAGSAPYNKTVDTKLTIMVASDAPAGHDHAFQVTATYIRGTPNGCQAAGDLPKASGTAKHALVTGNSASAATGMTGMSGADHAKMTNDPSSSPTTTSTPPPKRTPGASIALVVLAVAALAAALARRR